MRGIIPTIILTLLLLSAAHQASADIKYTYDASGKIIEARKFDNSGNQIEGQGFDYDSNGRLVKIRKLITGDKIEDIRRTNFIYDDTKNTVTIKDARGKTTTIQKDNNGNITQVTYPDGLASEWTYNEQGKVSVIHDPAGGRTRIGYNKDGQIDRIVNPTNSEDHLLKNKQGEIIAYNGNTIIPGSLQMEPIFSTDSTAITSWLESGKGPLSLVYGFNSSVFGNIDYQPTEFILNGMQKSTQEDFDKALETTIEVAKRMTQIKSCGPLSELRETQRGEATRDLVRELAIGLGEEKAQVWELWDKIIKENPELKEDMEEAMKFYFHRLEFKGERVPGIVTEIKRQYDSKGRLTRIITPQGDIVYEYSDDANIPSYLANIPSTVTSIPKEYPAEKAEKLKYQKDSTGKVQAITRQIDGESTTHDVLTGQYITGNKDLEKKNEYDLRGFPTATDKSFITLPGGILPEPTAQKPSINKLHFTADGKTYTKDTSGKLVEVIDGFVRDSSGKPVVATGIEIVRPAEKDPIRDLDLGADRLAAISESGDPLALYTQTNDGLIETKATDGSSLYLHVDAYGKVVEVKNKRGKTLNKFTYDPSSEELYSETIHELLQEDLNNIYKLGANNLGKLMELAMGVAPASLVYDQSACEPTTPPEPKTTVPTNSPLGSDKQSCKGNRDVCLSGVNNVEDACTKDAYNNYLDCKNGCEGKIDVSGENKCAQACYRKYNTTGKDCAIAFSNQHSACMKAYYFCLKNCPIGGDFQPLSGCSSGKPVEPPKCVNMTFEAARTEAEEEKARQEELTCSSACWDAYMKEPNSCIHECDYKKRIGTQTCSDKAGQCNQACEDTFVVCYGEGWCDTKQDELDKCHERCDFEEVACNQPIEPAFKQCQGSCISIRDQCLPGCRTRCSKQRIW